MKTSGKSNLNGFRDLPYKDSYTLVIGTVNNNCKSGNIQTFRILRYLQKNGHRIVSVPEEADILILSTCGVFERFERDSRSLFRSSRAGMKPRILSIGCLNKTVGGLFEAYPSVLFIDDLDKLDDYFFRRCRFRDMNESTYHHSCVSQLIPFNREKTGLFGRIALTSDRLKYHTLNAILPAGARLLEIYHELRRKNKFYVAIGTGCAGSCSYCVEKRIWGRVVSRRIADIMKDIARGYLPHLKLCLVSHDCGCFGQDTGENLFQLLESVDREFPDLEIEISNINPYWIEVHESAFLDIFSRGIKIRSLNIPLQSGSDRIVKLMNRQYSVERIVRIIKEIRTLSPQALIWTQMMVGFPGETWEDFSRTLAVVKHYDFIMIFLYSEREGTPSCQLPCKVLWGVKILRLLFLHGWAYSRFGRRLAADVLGRTS